MSLVLIVNSLFMKKKNKIFSKRLCWTLLITLIVGLILGGVALYRLVWAPNFHPKETVYLYIDQTKDYASLCQQLTDSAACAHLGGFKWLSSWLKYPEHMRTGRYAVEPGMSNWALLTNLRRGLQSATRVTFTNIRLKSDLAERLDEQLMLGKE